MKNVLRSLSALGLVLAAACSPVPIEGTGTGAVSVSVTQALQEVTPATIDSIVVHVYSGSGATAVLNGTHVLGYNGSAWTATIQGIPAGEISITAEAYAGGSTTPVFVSNPATVTIVVGSTATAHIVLHQVALQEGIQAPVLNSVTTTETAVRPGQTVDITVCVTDPDGDDVTLHATGDDAGGSFTLTSVAVPLDASNTGCATIGWTAPNEPSGLLPEEIELEITDSSGAQVRLQLFFRVIWESEEIELDFELNLAPVVTSLRVAPANPVDGQGTPLVLGAELGSLTVGFTAFDPDGQSGETLQYSWSIPEDCGSAWKWVKVWFVDVPEYIDAAGDLGTGSSLYSMDHNLAFPFNPANECTLTLTVTDGEGLSTTSTLVINPFDVVMRYTPTLEISFQNGNLAVPGHEIDFGVVSFLRIYDDYVGPPLIQWSLGHEAPFVTAAVVEGLPPEGLDLPFASTYRWDVTSDPVGCRADPSGTVVPVTVQACNPVHTDLCNAVEFTVEVPDTAICAAP